METTNMTYVRAELAIRFNLFKKHNVDIRRDDKYINVLKKDIKNDPNNFFDNIVDNLSQMLNNPKHGLWSEMYNLPNDVIYALYKLYCVEHKN
jgi:hypothetical protein